MDSNPIPLSTKLLLNAESFGFGPTAAIADFFPHLRKHFQFIGYVGSGHSLDLQRSFPYDEIIDLTGKESSAFDEVVAHYDLFFTTMEFEFAERAVAKGIPTVIYDPLTWFWREVPKVVANDNVLYLAQGFHGVKERLLCESEKFGQPLMVAPLTKRVPRAKISTMILLNMGGLANPFWSLELCCDYAAAMIHAVKQAADPFLDIQILCSSKVAELLPDTGICTLSREEVLEILPRVKVAVQTPGLANIYDAASHRMPTLFLPPANDSQGQQLDLLRAHDQADAFVEWDDLPGGARIDYQGEKKEVMKAITQQVERLTRPETAACLARLIRERLPDHTPTRIPTLLEQYGEGGVEQVANLVVQKAREEAALV